MDFVNTFRNRYFCSIFVRVLYFDCCIISFNFERNESHQTNHAICNVVFDNNNRDFKDNFCSRKCKNKNIHMTQSKTKEKKRNETMHKLQKNSHDLIFALYFPKQCTKPMLFLQLIPNESQLRSAIEFIFAEIS